MKVLSRGIIGFDLCFGKMVIVGYREGGKRNAKRLVRDYVR